MVGIFYETLLDQAHRAVKLVEFAIDNLIHHVGGLAFDLAHINRLFGIDYLRWHFFPAHVKRMRRGDV